MFNTLKQHWNTFWYQESGREVLGFLRIAVGIVLLLRLTGTYGISQIGNINPDFPKHFFGGPDDFFLDAHRMPYAFFEWLPVPTLQGFWGLETFILVLAVFFTLGLGMRFVGPLLALTYGYLFLLSGHFYAHNLYLLLIALFVLGFSHSAQCYSVDSIFRKKHALKDRASMVPLRLIQVTVTFVYIGSFLSKLDTSWYTGTVMQLMYKNGTIQGPIAELVLQFVNFQVLSLLTHGMLFVLIPTLWIPKLRTFSITVALLLHLGIDAMMDVSTYSYLMLALYIAFMNPELRQNTVLFDGYCLLCQRTRRIVSYFDWFKRLKWQNIHNKSEISHLAELPNHNALMKEMYFIDQEKVLHKGYFAWRKIFSLMPLTFPLALLMYIPGVSLVGTKIYAYVAKNRYRLH